MRKIIEILLIISIIINLLILISSYTSLFGYRTFEIVTGSMEPTIKTSSVVIVKKQTKYKVNDIITIKDKDRDIYYTHRINSITKNKVITIGDNNNTTDDTNYVSNIVGKVKIILTDFQYLMIKLSCIALLAITILVSFYKRKDR